MNGNKGNWATAAATAALLVIGIGIGIWLPRHLGSSEPSAQAALRAMPADVAAGYRFVEAHHDMATRLPCYCGCGPTLSHQNLWDCFIKPTGYNDHALFCDICVRIANDAEQSTTEGQGLASIRARIDEKYEGLAPPTNTP